MKNDLENTTKERSLEEQYDILKLDENLNANKVGMELFETIKNSYEKGTISDVKSLFKEDEENPGLGTKVIDIMRQRSNLLLKVISNIEEMNKGVEDKGRIVKLVLECKEEIEQIAKMLEVIKTFKNELEGAGTGIFAAYNIGFSVNRMGAKITNNENFNAVSSLYNSFGNLFRGNNSQIVTSICDKFKSYVDNLQELVGIEKKNVRNIEKETKLEKEVKVEKKVNLEKDNQLGSSQGINLSNEKFAPPPPPPPPPGVEAAKSNAPPPPPPPSANSENTLNKPTNPQRQDLFAEIRARKDLNKTPSREGVNLNEEGFVYEKLKMDKDKRLIVSANQDLGQFAGSKLVSNQENVSILDHKTDQERKNILFSAILDGANPDEIDKMKNYVTSVPDIDENGKVKLDDFDEEIMVEGKAFSNDVIKDIENAVETVQERIKQGANKANDDVEAESIKEAGKKNIVKDSIKNSIQMNEIREEISSPPPPPPPLPGVESGNESVKTHSSKLQKKDKITPAPNRQNLLEEIRSRGGQKSSEKIITSKSENTFNNVYKDELQVKLIKGRFAKEDEEKIVEEILANKDEKGQLDVLYSNVIASNNPGVEAIIENGNNTIFSEDNLKKVYNAVQNLSESPSLSNEKKKGLKENLEKFAETVKDNKKIDIAAEKGRGM